LGEVFNIRHETDLSEYDSTVVDGGDLSQDAAAALGGTSGGLKCVLDDTNVIYGHKDFVQLAGTAYRYRFYVDPNGLTMANWDNFMLCALRDGGSTRSDVFLQRDNASHYEIAAFVLDDTSTWQSTSYYDVTDAEHYVEILVQYASSDIASDGSLTLWIDGAQQEQVGSLDIYDVSQPQDADLGAVFGIDAGTSGTFYLDELVLRDDNTEIGPYSAGGGAIAPQAMILRRQLTS